MNDIISVTNWMINIIVIGVSVRILFVCIHTAINGELNIKLIKTYVTIAIIVTAVMGIKEAILSYYI